MKYTRICPYVYSGIMRVCVCVYTHTHTHTHTHTYIYIYIYIYKHLNYYRISKRGVCLENEKHRKLWSNLICNCSFLLYKSCVTRIPTTYSEVLCVCVVWSLTTVMITFHVFWCMTSCRLLNRHRIKRKWQNLSSGYDMVLLCPRRLKYSLLCLLLCIHRDVKEIRFRPYRSSVRNYSPILRKILKDFRSLHF